MNSGFVRSPAATIARNLDGVSTLPVQPTAKPRSPANRIVPPDPARAAIVIGAFTALLYLVEAVDAVLPANLDNQIGRASCRERV